MSKSTSKTTEASAANAQNDDLESLSFESAMHALQEIVTRMESDTLSLEEMLESYERGMALSAICQKSLDEAALRIEKITDGLHAETIEFDANRT